MMNEHFMQGAEPFFLRGGGTIGCLLLHGLSASPEEMRWLGDYLNGQGTTVYAARLHGHGIAPEEMLRMRWQDWYYSALDGYHLLKSQCTHVFVMGQSMGGLVALRLAATQEVAGVGALAAPLLLNFATPSLFHVLRYVVGYVVVYDRATDPIDQKLRDYQREHNQPVLGRVAYYKQSAAGLSELFKLQQEVQDNLSRIKAPALLIYSEKDATVPARNVSLLQAGLTASAGVETLLLQQSDHVITQGVECETVFAACAAFIKQHSSAV